MISSWRIRIGTSLGAVFLLLLLFPFPSALADGLPDLTLQQCIRITLSKHPDIAAAQARVAEKQGEVSESQSHTYPSLLGTGSFVHVSPVLFAVFGPFSFPIDAANSFNTGIEVRYSIYNGEKRNNAVKAAELGLSSQKFDSERVALEKVLSVKTAFYRVLLGKERIRAARWSLNEAELNAATAEQLYKTGAAPRLAFLNARIREKGAEQALASAVAGYTEDLANLAVAIGLKPGEVGGAVGILSEPELPSYEGLLQEAYAARPEIKEDQANIEQEKVRLSIASATNSPDLSLFAGGFFFTRPFIPFSSVFQDQAGVQITWPFEFGKQGAEVEKERANLKGAQARLEEDRHEIALKLSTAYTDAEQAGKDIETYAQNVAEARKSFEDSIAAFANGLITGTQLDETLDLSNQSNQSYLHALYRYDEALARISYLLGKLQ